MAVENYDYIQNEFSFDAGRNSPKGLDYVGMDEIASLRTKIEIDSLREHFTPSGEMKAISYQDWLFEVRITKSKY